MPPDTPPCQPRPAGYGKACSNCFRAKCKCILVSADGPCERCGRLGRECKPIRRGRRDVAARLTVARTAELEQQLASLEALLQATPEEGSQQGRQESGSASPFRPICPSTMEQEALSDNVPGRGSESVEMELEQDARCTAKGSPWANLLPTGKEAQDLLAKFRAWLPNFPFMHLPASTTAATLCADKPFLWLCITTLTCMSNSQHRKLRDVVRRELSERIIINHERNIDLLLGLIAYLGWSCLNIRPEFKPFIVLYTHLTSLMANELGLLRPDNDEHFTSMRWKSWDPSQYVPTIRTMQDIKAALATWFLTSLGNSFTTRIDTLPWTPYLDECVESIERSDDQEGGDVLITLVKIQRVLDEANQSLRSGMTCGGRSDDRPSSSLHQAALLQRLEYIRAEMKQKRPTHNLLQLQLSAAAVHIQAMGVFQADKPSPLQSVESMWSCAAHAKAFFDAFFAIPAADFAGLPFYVHFVQASVQLVVYRLTLANPRVWRSEAVRKQVDILDVLDRSIALVGDVSRVYVMTDEDLYGNVFRSGARYLHNLRCAWQSTLEGEAPGHLVQGSHQGTGHGPSSATEMAHALMFPGGTGLQMSERSWIAEILGLWQI